MPGAHRIFTFIFIIIVGILSYGMADVKQIITGVKRHEDKYRHSITPKNYNWTQKNTDFKEKTTHL